MGTSTHRLEFDSHGHLPMNLGQRSRTLSTDVVAAQVDDGEGRVDRQRLRHHGVKCLLRIACWPNAYKARWQIKCNICRAETSALGTAIVAHAKHVAHTEPDGDHKHRQSPAH